VLGVMNGLNDVFVISRKIKEAPALARRSKLGEDILAGEGHEVICRVEFEDGA
jgi:hypothetical protein